MYYIFKLSIQTFSLNFPFVKALVILVFNYLLFKNDLPHKYKLVLIIFHSSINLYNLNEDFYLNQLSYNHCIIFHYLLHNSIDVMYSNKYFLLNVISFIPSIFAFFLLSFVGHFPIIIIFFETINLYVLIRQFIADNIGFEVLNFLFNYFFDLLSQPNM